MTSTTEVRPKFTALFVPIDKPQMVAVARKSRPNLCYETQTKDGWFIFFHENPAEIRLPPNHELRPLLRKVRPVEFKTERTVKQEKAKAARVQAEVEKE